ncbi:MAG: ABC transporter ATP-binding protein [Treponema sp.]|jgi:simple sugar transport system ATP-binding protein|nr:ABC transporter ATP-binding protein [Treponema sp.]
MEHAVELRGVTKIFPGEQQRANNNVSLYLDKGEILCLAGENGAGKTTLMKILYGLIPPTQGEILVGGRPADIRSPLDANRLGIGMVHQHFMLFPDFTVAENVVMGIEPVKGFICYDFAQAKKLAAEVINRHHFSIDPDAPVKSLTVGQMQQVEIVKMLYRRAEILILDEPTAVLTEQETAAIFDTFRTLADSGRSLVLITHKLKEITQISHRVAVMRRGEMVSVCNTRDIDEYEISRLMVGRGVDLKVNRGRRPPPKEDPVLSFRGVTVKRQDQERPLLQDVSFTVHAGEILGFAGVAGNGLGEMEEILGGSLPLSSGKILHHDRDITGFNSVKLRREGLAYVPGDRLNVGSASNAAVAENIIINQRRRLSRGGFLDRKAVEQFTEKLLAEYSVSGGSRQRIGSLSGGNIQKVILAREIVQYQDYIVFSEPTWGLDIASSRYMYDQMALLREAGAAVILISSNLDEILANADRILVMYRGTIAAEILRGSLASAGTGEEDAGAAVAVKEEIGAFMLGLKTQIREPQKAGTGGVNV